MCEVYRLIKRIIDFCLSLFCLIIFSPVLLLLAISILISAGRPIIFTSERIGKDKKRFKVYKFRTLINGLKRRKDGLSKKIVCNKLADFMRGTHLDEILQLVNVITGDIALIGPRPLDVLRYRHLKKLEPEWGSIFKVKPGMTCINQIARYSSWGMNAVKKLKGLEKMKRRNRLLLDQYYIKHESPLLDLKITLWTIAYLISGFVIRLFRKSNLEF